MANEITMPSMGADMTEGTIVKWLKNEGDKVSKGDKLAEIETDKTVVEMEAYDEGFLRKITSIEGSVVQVGKIIGYIGDMDEDIPEKVEESKETVLTEETSNKISDSTSIKETISSDSGEEVHNSTKDLQKVDITLSSNSIRIKASPMAKRLASEKNINLADIKGSGPDGRLSLIHI